MGNFQNPIEFEKSINQYMRVRTPVDVVAIYETLKDKLPLTLTSAYQMENGKEDYDADYIMVCGTSSVGTFQLYDDGLYGVFDVEKADGSYAHWHPADINEAVNMVEKFMEGKLI